MRITTVLNIAGQCTAPGCQGQICHTCWTVKRRRLCSAHEEAAD
jgi:hypothetical protein